MCCPICAGWHCNPMIADSYRHPGRHLRPYPPRSYAHRAGSAGAVQTRTSAFRSLRHPAASGDTARPAARSRWEMVRLALNGHPDFLGRCTRSVPQRPLLYGRHSNSPAGPNSARNNPCASYSSGDAFLQLHTWHEWKTSVRAGTLCGIATCRKDNRWATLCFKADAALQTEYQARLAPGAGALHETHLTARFSSPTCPHWKSPPPTSAAVVRDGKASLVTWCRGCRRQPHQHQLTLQYMLNTKEKTQAVALCPGRRQGTRYHRHPDTSKLSPLFECMVVASAQSTRQTKALACGLCAGNNHALERGLSLLMLMTVISSALTSSRAETTA